jgi:hypothetical protein
MAVDTKTIIKWICFASVGLMLLFSILSFTVWNNTCSDNMVAYFKGLAVLGFVNAILIVGYQYSSTVRTYLPAPTTLSVGK